ELVAAIGPLLCLPQLAGLRIHRESAAIAMSDGVNRRFESCAAGVWIVVRNAAVVAEPDGFSGVVIQILRPRGLGRARRADGHVQHAVASEGNARGLGIGGAGVKNLVRVDEAGSIPCPSRENCFSLVSLNGLV